MPGPWGPETPLLSRALFLVLALGFPSLPCASGPKVARWPRQGQAGAAERAGESDGAARAPAGAGFASGASQLEVGKGGGKPSSGRVAGGGSLAQGIYRRQGLGRPDQPLARSAQGLDRWGPSAGMQVGQALRPPGTTESQTEEALVTTTENVPCALWACEAAGPGEPPASPLHPPPPTRMRLQVWRGREGGEAVGVSGLGGQGAQLRSRAGETWGGACTPPPRGVPGVYAEGTGAPGRVSWAGPSTQGWVVTGLSM